MQNWAGREHYGTNERYGGVTLEWREAPFFPVTTYRAPSTDFPPLPSGGALSPVLTASGSQWQVPVRFSPMTMRRRLHVRVTTYVNRYAESWHPGHGVTRHDSRHSNMPAALWSLSVGILLIMQSRWSIGRRDRSRADARGQEDRNLHGPKGRLNDECYELAKASKTAWRRDISSEHGAN